MFPYYYFMKSFEFSDLLLYIKSYFLIHNLLQEKEPCKVFQIHTFHAVPLRNLLFPWNYFCSMLPLSGSSSFPYLSHLDKTLLFIKLMEQKAFHHNLLKARFKIIQKLPEYTNFLSRRFIQFFTFVDLTGIFIINYKNYINISS